MSWIPVVNTVITSLSLTVLIPCGLYFIYARDIQPIKARSKPLVFIYWCSLMAQVLRRLIGSRGVTNSCYATIWLSDAIYPCILIITFVRCVRLLSIFNLTQRTLRLKHKYKSSSRSSGSSTGSDDEERTQDAVKTTWIQDKNLLILFAVMYGTVLLIPAIMTIIAASTECKGRNATYITISLAVAIIVLLIIISVLLRKAHDAFFIKDEFRWFAIAGIAFGMGGEVFSAIKKVKPYSGIVVNLCFLALPIIGFLVPSIMAFRNQPPEFLSSFMSTLRGDTSKSSDSQKEVLEEDDDENAFVPFRKYPNVSSLLSDDKSTKFLEKYLIDNQNIEMSNCLVFWRQVIAFREIKKKEYLPGKACILYQRFVAPGAYLHIRCFPQEQKEKVQTVIESVLKDEEAKLTIEESLFDELLETIEDELYKHVFIPFYKSKFYQQYIQFSKLNAGVVSVTKRPKKKSHINQNSSTSNGTGSNNVEGDSIVASYSGATGDSQNLELSVELSEKLSEHTNNNDNDVKITIKEKKKHKKQKEQQQRSRSSSHSSTNSTKSSKSQNTNSERNIEQSQQSQLSQQSQQDS